MKKPRLYDEFIKLLIEVNDESVSKENHDRLLIELHAWKRGVEDATGHTFNGDYYYIELGVDRPMCCGVFLDWEHKQTLTA
jgi:hypothetical protein